MWSMYEYWAFFFVLYNTWFFGNRSHFRRQEMKIESCGPTRVATVVYCLDFMTEIEYSVFLTKAQRCYFITHVNRELLDLIEGSARPSQRHGTEPHFRSFRISLLCFFFNYPFQHFLSQYAVVFYVASSHEVTHPQYCINTCSLVFSKFLACVSLFYLILVCHFRAIFSNICNLCSPRD
jgi:hypothetical protein